jgi:hypothetical protein
VLDRLLSRPADRAGPVVFVIDACRSSGLENARQFDNDYRILVNNLGADGAPASITLQDLAYSGQGLAQVSRARGLNAVVLFSTEPGNLALDGIACAPGQAPADFRRKRNRGDLDDDLRACGFSPFARAIYYEIDRRASFDDVARRISNRVACETARFDEGNADNCASARVARRVSRDATTVAQFRQSPWRQGDVGFPIYLAGEPRFPVP